jgi:hypothetical protein
VGLDVLDELDVNIDGLKDLGNFLSFYYMAAMDTQEDEEGMTIMDEIENQEQIYNTSVDNYNASLQTYNESTAQGEERQTEYRNIQNEYRAVRQAYVDYTFFLRDAIGRCQTEHYPVTIIEGLQDYLTDLSLNLPAEPTAPLRGGRKSRRRVKRSKRSRRR